MCRALLPEEMLRRKKRGFAGNVVHGWFRGSVSTEMKETLMGSESLMYRYLRPAAVQRLFKQHQAGQNDHHKILYSLMVFETWLRVHSAPEACLV